MKKNNSLIIFSAALVLSAVIISGSIIYTSKNTSGSDEHVVVTDEHANTYVVEKDEPLKLTIISDTTCDNCDTEKIEDTLKKQTGLPLAVRRLDYGTAEAKKIINDNEANFLPYLLMGKEIEKQPNFAHLTHHFISKAKKGYFVDLMKMGAPIGRYLDATYYAKDDPSAPKITSAEESEYDFKDVHLSDGKVSAEFVIKNEGKSPLEFLNANTSCGCTSTKIVLPNESSPEYTMAGHGAPVKWHGSLAPGEEGKIMVYYDPTVHPDLNSAVTRTVTIDTNDPNTPQLKLKIHANQISD